MAIFRQTIKNFSGGLLEDKRISSPSHFSLTKHFDAFTYPSKLVPYAKRETSNGLVSGVVTDLKLTRFIYAPTASGGSTFRLWALGDDGTGKVKIYKLDIDGSSNLDTTFWTAATNGTSSSGTRSENVLFYYKGIIYTISGTTNLNQFDVAESTGWVDGYQTLGTTTNAIQPVYHPSDDCAYFFSDNIVYQLNNVTWSTSLTLPSDMQIVTACPYGNYLAIGMTTKGSLNKRSIVFLWDRDSSITTLTERIDLGECDLKHLATLNGKLIAVTSTYLTNTYGLSKGKIQIKTPSGTSFVTLNEITTDATQVAADLPITNFVRDNKLYFPMKATLRSDARVGIWVVDQNGKVTLDTIEPALDTHANASAIKGIYATASLWWIAYDDGSGGVGGYSVTRTDDDGAYDSVNPSIYESLIFSTIHVTNRGVVIQNPAVTKQLRGVTVMTEPLTSGQSVKLKARWADNINALTSWTTILTHSTVNEITDDATNVESDGSHLPQYNEIEFRLESYGGAVITGFEYSGETKNDATYD